VHLKKLHRVEGGTKFFWGISCEKSRFYANKSYFFQFKGGGGTGCIPPGSAPAFNSENRGINITKNIIKLMVDNIITQCSIFYISFDITLSFYMIYDCVRNYFKSVF
jgi:hypothetical protein